MKLRSQRSPQDANSTAGTADADANAQPPSCAQGSIGQASHRSQPQRQAAANSPKRPDLIDLVLRQMGRMDIFSKDSLWALSETSRSFRRLVRETVSVPPIKVMEKYQGVQRLLESPGIVPYLEWFQYKGYEEPIPDPEFDTLVGLLGNSQRLNTLILNPAGYALNSLSSIALPKLTCLELHNMYGSNEGLKELVQKQHAWPLRELSLHFMGKANALVVVSAVLRFPDLRKLELSGLHSLSFKAPVSSKNLDLEFRAKSLPMLEEMSIDLPCGRFLELISVVKLPALINFGVQNYYSQHSLESSARQLSVSLWLPQLQSLVLAHSIHCLTPADGSMEMMMAKLGAGALTKLTLDDWKEDEKMLNIINLPNLEHLEITIPLRMPLNFYARNKPVGMMTALATASLPNLHTLVIKADDRSLTEGDMSALAGAFPKLRSFSIVNLAMEKSDMQTFIAKVLPQLEELSLGYMIQNFLKCVIELGPSHVFPLLRKLVGYWVSLEKDDLPSLAEHMPNLVKIEHW